MFNCKSNTDKFGHIVDCEACKDKLDTIGIQAHASIIAYGSKDLVENSLKIVYNFLKEYYNFSDTQYDFYKEKIQEWITKEGKLSFIEHCKKIICSVFEKC